jgi:hypothetical protein
MLMTLTASFPNVTNTTTITPRIFSPMPAQRLLYVGRTSALSKIPHDPHILYCSYNLIGRQLHGAGSVHRAAGKDGLAGSNALFLNGFLTRGHLR